MSISEPRVLGGRYELGPVVGRGGMAEVHRGRDVRLEREVAVKTLRADLARDPTFQARFRREAQSAAQLNHPSVVAVYDTGEDAVDGTSLPYIVMEYVEGQTLRDVLRDAQRFMPERALEVISGVLLALAYSHRMGIVHRDIKPGNVMLTRNGDIKVMDFGIARSVADAQATMTQTAQVIGTAQYLSPEQARGEKVDARSDLYSTGCVLYELLTGRPPFSGDSPVSVAYQHVREDPVPPSHVNPDVPPAIDAIVLKALAKNPDNRYQSAEEMRADIERSLSGQPVYATPVLDGQATERFGTPTAATAVLTGRPDEAYPEEASEEERDGRRRRRAIGFALLGLAIAAIVVGGLLFANYWQQRQQELAQVTVPDVLHDQVNIATEKLRRQGLEVATTQRFSGRQKGTVIAQSPQPQATASKGDTVHLTVSKGRQMVTVPSIEGQSRSDAEALLQDAGLQVGDVTHESSGEDKGIVLSSDPSGGESVLKGSSVDLVVSSGQSTVPNVYGEPKDQAKADLSDAGFEVDVIKQETDQAEPGTVIAQSPAAGTDADQGSTVTITVAKAAPEPSPTPSDTETSTSPSPTPTDSSTSPSPTDDGLPGIPGGGHRGPGHDTGARTR